MATDAIIGVAASVLIAIGSGISQWRVRRQSKSGQLDASETNSFTGLSDAMLQTLTEIRELNEKLNDVTQQLHECKWTVSQQGLQIKQQQEQISVLTEENIQLKKKLNLQPGL